MDEQNRKAIRNSIYLFSGFVLISIMGGFIFISLSRMETDANRYKKNKALEQIEKQYKECRKQDTDKLDWEERLVKCEIEKMRKENKLTY